MEKEEGETVRNMGKKSKIQQKYLNITCQDLWRIRDKLDGKKSGLGKTNKANFEANDKVYELNQQASKYLENLALLYSNFEQAGIEKKEAEEQFDQDFDESLRREPCALPQVCTGLCQGRGLLQ